MSAQHTPGRFTPEQIEEAKRLHRAFGSERVIDYLSAEMAQAMAAVDATYCPEYVADAAIAKATEPAYQGVRCQCIVTGCRPGPGCPVYSKTHCESHMAFVRGAKATGSAA